MTRKRNIQLILVWLLAFSLLAGCQAGSLNIKPLDQMTPQEKGLWMNKVYTSEYDRYEVDVNKPNPSEEQKKSLQVRYRILTNIHPLIRAYNKYIQTGVVPYAQLEADIVSKLTLLLGEGG